MPDEQTPPNEDDPLVLQLLRDHNEWIRERGKQLHAKIEEFDRDYLCQEKPE